MMRFGPLRLGTWRATRPTLLRVYLLGGSIVLAVALLLYFHRLAVRVDDHTEAMGELVAKVIAFTTLTVESTPDAQTQGQFEAAIHALPFPVMITHVSGLPLTWNAQVGIPNLSIEEILAEDPENPSATFQQIEKARQAMDREHDPLAMLEPGTPDTVMFLHYGSPTLAGELRLTPWITIVVAAVFGVVGLLLFRNFKRAEESFIWAGMAKESAHQMGTPLSSLIGWVEVLREEARPQGDQTVLPRKSFEEMVGEIEADTGRLNRVAARFSQIGSRPRLQETEVAPVVEGILDYLRRRAPESVTLDLEVAEGVPPAQLNPELFGWVIENLVKNALNAVDSGTGRIRTRIAPAPGGRIEIRVEDNGRGVTPGMEQQIFRPGVSTRHRGWGLGLPLARRIVEQYHGGRLDLVRSVPGRGAVFQILLPGTR